VKSDDEWASVIGKLEMFQGLPKKSLTMISRSMKEHTYPSGATVLEEDTDGNTGRMYVVVEGTARAEIDGRSVADFGAGDHFGEMSLLDGGPRSATVVATSDLVLASLASWNFRPILLEEPSIAVHLIEVLAKRLRASNRPRD